MLRMNACPAIAAPRSQRLLMTADASSDAWGFAMELSRALVASGHEVALATMGALPDREQRREANAISGLSLYPSAYRLLWVDDAWNDVEASGHWLLDVAAAVQPSVVHLNDFGHALLPWKAPLLLTAHGCACTWWQSVHGAPPHWRRYRAHVAAALKAADQVVTPSYAMQRALQRHYGAVAARVIPHGHAALDVEPAPSTKARLIFASGSLDDRGRNLGALVRAASRLDWPVCIAAAVRAENDAPMLADDVCLLGHLTRRQVRGWLARAPIYALPARYESHPLQLLEAGLSRCALVLGDIDALRETWDGAAVFVDPEDRDALAHAVQRLIDDQAERDYYATRALVRARRYRATAMAAAYANAYAELVLREQGVLTPALHGANATA